MFRCSSYFGLDFSIVGGRENEGLQKTCAAHIKFFHILDVFCQSCGGVHKVGLQKNGPTCDEKIHVGLKDASTNHFKNSFKNCSKKSQSDNI